MHNQVSPEDATHARLPFRLSRAHGYEGSCGQCSADVELSSGSHSAQGGLRVPHSSLRGDRKRRRWDFCHPSLGARRRLAMPMGASFGQDLGARTWIFTCLRWIGGVGRRKYARLHGRIIGIKCSNINVKEWCGIQAMCQG